MNALIYHTGNNFDSISQITGGMCFLIRIGHPVNMQIVRHCGFRHWVVKVKYERYSIYMYSLNKGQNKVIFLKRH